MTKKYKTDKCREILNKYSLNAIVSDENDISFLLSIFKNHNEWGQKKGVGIQSISIKMSNFKNRYFQLNRFDGTYTDISFPHCINNKSKKADIIKACRNAIRSEIINYKNNSVVYGVSTCPITGDVLNIENTHIDHYDLEFNPMFKKWFKKYDEELLFSKINQTVDNSFETYFTDSLIIEDFKKFHNEHSKLRAVSKKANLSILKNNSKPK